ncbi:golgin subfamily A member 2-like isoform X2 [Xyrauchen texanus]|uniref:golgin subfamily A member 2-like isoform X2 n=1 Tax=Xyrauchen texanus TaxID=154827 RepID=UPI0022425B2E|nr:golgin subfamily A member 2-like isoform X2 [Xyrauchen texanus]
MADQNRQTKLAAAKKRLKEFQQKTTPSTGSAGPKKKRKVKGEGQPNTPADRLSPDNDHVDVMNRVSPDLEETSAEHERDSAVCNLASAINSECVTHNAVLQQNSTADSNGDQHHVEENRTLSSTESLRQLSQQLNGLLSESTTYINGESGPPTVSEKDLEIRNRELAAALDSSMLTNTQLTAKLETLTRQTQELSEQLQKERKEFEHKFNKEHGAIREQLQVHIQTIGILVSEKSDLQTALSYTQHAARQKTVEAEDLNSRLHASKQRVSELERTLSTVSTQQKHFEKHNKELEKERDRLRLEVLRFTNLNDESRQQSSELSEQLKLRVNENNSMKLELDELRKRLEMADDMLQQFSSESGHPSEHQQVQLLLEEKHQLESHTAQLMESVTQLQVERDQYAVQIQEEGQVWKDKTEQLLSQMRVMSEERHSSAAQIQELQEKITELENAAAVMRKEQEAQSVSQISGQSETELALQETINNLQHERDALSLQFQAQVRDNEQLSRLVQEQETRLEQLERQTERTADDAQIRLRILEDAQSDKATISRALAQNRDLKDQLAELQNGFVKLTNENMELASALQSEQHIKKEIAHKIGQLQEDLHNAKEQLLEKSQEVMSVQEQRDQYLAHLQQYIAGYQQLVSEREHLHKQFLHQVQLMDRLQHDEVQGKVQLEQSHLELQQAQEKLNQLARDNEELKTEVQELLNSSTPNPSFRDQGDGLESQSLPESFLKSQIAIPEDFESREDMVQFVHFALSRLEEERDEMSRQFEEERRLHHAARQQMAAMSHEHQRHHHHHNSAPGETGAASAQSLTLGGSDGVPVEVHEALRAAMEKLQERFTAVMHEKVDLKDRVEELEHRCIQLSGETDTIGEYIALYQNQRAIMKQRHFEKEQYINILAKDKEEMKVKLAELQDLVMRLVSERNEWYSRCMSPVSNPDLLLTGEDRIHPAERLEELNGEDSPAILDMSSTIDLQSSAPQSSTEPEMQYQSPERPGSGTDLSAGSSLRPKEDGTARQIMQLLQEIQNPQARPPPFLGENPCIPFFYRPDEHDEVKILVV